MPAIASSTSWPTVGCFAWAFTCTQRASGGTQKMLSARYSSGSSGSAPLALLGDELGLLLFKGVGDVLKEDEPEDYVLVLGRIHGATQGVRHLPELGFIAHCGGPLLSILRHVVDAFYL